MFNPNDMYAQTARRHDLQREADNHALASQVSTDGEAPFYAPVLARLGNLMVGVGSDLQARYGTWMEEAQHIQSGQQSASQPSQATL